ncbi:hypothetical protein NQ314_010877 [Rhamnusium bicolor]|uniref:Uncharacterized protein n=1 Tax=Rhamnusium bicolor TaxID=1586634 RepID=A0AAV8XN79_9CUCU|nr:hypothetical protein NQ314_010877 [Rhamnusium bicolor]
MSEVGTNEMPLAPFPQKVTLNNQEDQSNYKTPKAYFEAQRKLRGDHNEEYLDAKSDSKLLSEKNYSP